MPVPSTDLDRRFAAVFAKLAERYTMTPARCRAEYNAALRAAKLAKKHP